MTDRELAYASAAAGLGGCITTSALDALSIMEASRWEIALSFPVSAVTFLVCWLLGEQWEARSGRS